MSGEAPDLREQEGCPSNTICHGTCDQHSPLRPAEPRSRVENVPSADVEALADLIAKAHPFWSNEVRGLHVCIAKDVLASDWLAAHTAAARAEALRDAANEIEDLYPCPPDKRDDRTESLVSPSWLRDRADSEAQR